MQRPSRNCNRLDKFMLGFGVFCLAAPAVSAQTISEADAPGRPVVAIVRTKTPPRIDGVLDDAVWAQSAIIDQFTQVDPDEGAEPTQRTVVRLLLDEGHLYIGIRCFESDPSMIRATQMLRDGDLGFDDSVSVAIDSFFKLRDGFLFEMNPVGSKNDALIENNRNLRFEWDGIWEGKSSIDESGWSVEMDIPFKTLNFNPETDRWGFNVQRIIRHTVETVRWASPVRTRGLASVSTAGIIKGMENLKQGIGLDVKPFLVFRATHDDVVNDNDFQAEGGLDLFYNITPELTFAVTVNTDFAQTEVDQRQVNLSRFSLFFPEKRDFFLQDAGLFRFGGIRRNPLPFFSRRIGIGPDGEPVDIIAGLKLTGRVGNLNIGLLNVQLDNANDLEQKNITVGRLSLNVLEESSIGLIATIGDPQTNGDNALVGADFSFRNSRRFAPDVLEANGFFMHSKSSNTSGSQNAFGGRIIYNSDVFRWFAAFTQIDDDFNPALGFSNRRGIREYIGSGRYRWRPGTKIKRIDAEVRSNFITDLSNTLETRTSTLPRVVIETRSGDFLSADFTNRFERLTRDFRIRPGITIPQDEYTFNQGRLTLGSSRSRAIRGQGTIRFGEFFSGTRLDLIGSVDWRPNRFFAINLTYEQNEVDLPVGDFIVRIASMRLDINFTPDLSWITIAQWDNTSQLLGINSRVKWIIEPGQEIFFVLNQGFSTANDNFEPLTTELTLKVGLTIRF